jgi:hypothetical protein
VDAAVSDFSAEHVKNLVVATLAVGGYPLQRAWDLLPNLEKEGLIDPHAVQRCDEAEVVQRLARSGYDRGPTVTLSMATRLIALHEAVRNGILEQVIRLVADRKIEEGEDMLCRIKGIGPMVFKQFAALEEWKI